jgi:hypothetical protein
MTDTNSTPPKSRAEAVRRIRQAAPRKYSKTALKSVSDAGRIERLETITEEQGRTIQQLQRDLRQPISPE